jgi:hypothetical protein
VSTRLYSGLATRLGSPSNVGEFRLATQSPPDLVDRSGGGVHEVDTTRHGASDTRTGVAFGFCVPDLLDLQQTTVASADVVLAELECGSPPCSFQLPTVCLLQDRSVLALTQEPLTRSGKGSGNHGANLERLALWSVSADCL